MRIGLIAVVATFYVRNLATMSFPRRREPTTRCHIAHRMGFRPRGNNGSGDRLHGICLTVVGFALLLGIHAGAFACTPDLGGGKTSVKTVESRNYVLAFRTQPEKIEIGRHFALELALCAKAGAAAPESVRVDAHMPEHRHGMNYKTTVTSSGAGKYRAEGLLFHMPGRWEYIFEIRAAGATERLTTSMVLQ